MTIKFCSKNVNKLIVERILVFSYSLHLFEDIERTYLSKHRGGGGQRAANRIKSGRRSEGEKTTDGNRGRPRQVLDPQAANELYSYLF